jgi:hypothetical protein
VGVITLLYSWRGIATYAAYPQCIFDLFCESGQRTAIARQFHVLAANILGHEPVVDELVTRVGVRTLVMCRGRRNGNFVNHRLQHALAPSRLRTAERLKK